MKLLKKLLSIGALGLALAPAAANAEELTVERAREIVTPWYGLLNVAEKHDVRAVHEQVYTEDFQSCSGFLPSECHDREGSIHMIEAFPALIPDLRVAIHEILVSGDKIIVRADARGTPAKELFGVAPTGRSFHMMTLDILTVRDGKISHTYHLENWLSALSQIRGQ